MELLRTERITSKAGINGPCEEGMFLHFFGMRRLWLCIAF